MKYGILDAAKHGPYCLLNFPTREVENMYAALGHSPSEKTSKKLNEEKALLDCKD